MGVESTLEALLNDVRYGYVDKTTVSRRSAIPQVVLNTDASSMLRTIREELKTCKTFSFSVAFVSTRAIALLKQELVEFGGEGRIVTSDYLGFNRPEAFAELGNLQQLGIDSRLHRDVAYHPKGYIFGHDDYVTAILGSSNLTESALVRNHEWNLKVSAARGSALADELAMLVDRQLADSAPITDEWLKAYTIAYRERGATEALGVRPPSRIDFFTPDSHGSSSIVQSEPEHDPQRDSEPKPLLTPNTMQQEALAALDATRGSGKSRAIVISATGTGKTVLSALDVQNVNPRRMLFIVHREQVLDRAIAEYQYVLGATRDQFGKIGGGSSEASHKYVFATVQTLSRPDVLSSIPRDAFDYVLIDEVHRAGADSYARVLEHFQPQFLLGMTATPERSDGFNVFELFNFNVPYEIRLNRALEDGMLSPFHYYGVADAAFEDGSTASIDTGLSRLVSRARVEHVIEALERYGQAGVEPRGLIFCSRKEEARSLSAQLNESEFRGRRLRTVALTGEDSVENREAAVLELEAGELDYVLTVDVFNEGVDIPSINQVVMLRQTQSSIIFVQQLGRGLRLHEGKEYLVVIDFIGNYANNFLIPIALFGDESLNKESLRKSLLSAEESGVLPGLSSVRFDRVSQQRILESITATKLDSLQHLKSSIELMRNRLGEFPQLGDFLRFESVDPVLLATRHHNYPALLERLFRHESGLSPREHAALSLISSEMLAAKRPHELIVVKELLAHGAMSVEDLVSSFEHAGAAASAEHVESALRTLTLEFHTEGERKRYGDAIAVREGNRVELTHEFSTSYSKSDHFSRAVEDVLDTGLRLVAQRYDSHLPFTPGRQYSRKDACRLLLWNSNSSSTIYGYRVERATQTCPIFVTYHKDDSITASTAYEDELLDRRTMKWYTRSRRTLASDEVAAIVSNNVDVHVFAKKDDAEGSDFYYLGQARSSDAEQTTMPDDSGEQLNVVWMNLRFGSAIEPGVYDYFHPVVMD